MHERGGQHAGVRSGQLVVQPQLVWPGADHRAADHEPRAQQLLAVVPGVDVVDDVGAWPPAGDLVQQRGGARLGVDPAQNRTFMCPEVVDLVLGDRALVVVRSSLTA